MTNQEEQNSERSDTRVMWIATGVIVLILVGGMGINMLVHHDTIAGAPDAGSQSRPAPSN